MINGDIPRQAAHLMCQRWNHNHQNAADDQKQHQIYQQDRQDPADFQPIFQTVHQRRKDIRQNDGHDQRRDRVTEFVQEKSYANQRDENHDPFCLGGPGWTAGLILHHLIVKV
jgi:hypothetical protein